MVKRLITLGLCVVAAAGVLFADDTSAPASTEFDGEIPFGFNLDVAYEYRLAPFGEFLVEESVVKSGIDLMRNVFDRAPFARMALGYGRQEGLAVAIETTFRPQWDGTWYETDNLPTVGASGDPLKVENSFITRGVAYWRSPSLSFAFGRDKVDYGGILYGSLLPSYRLPYLDNLRARAVMGDFAIDYMLVTIQAIKSWDGIDVTPNDGSVEYYGWEDGENPTTIVEGLNRFSWKIGDLILAVSDHAMMARRNNRFYLTDFFPVISRHQTSILGTNNSLIFDASWQPLDGLKLAAQAGFDDINADIFGISDTSSPTIDAYVLGAEYRGSNGSGAMFASGEVGYTSYLWGNYDGSGIHPNDVNPFLRMQYRFLTDTGAMLLPLTSPYGPGAVWFKAKYRYEFLRTGFRAGLDLLLLSKNEEANLISTPLDRSAESGSIVYFGELSIPLDYAIGSWQATVTPAILYRSEDGSSPAWSFEITFLASYHLRTGTPAVAGNTPWAAP